MELISLQLVLTGREVRLFKRYCEVIYLPRTEGISSTMLRNAAEVVYKLGIIGTGRIAEKFVPESLHVEALRITSVYNPEDNVGATEFVDRFKIPNLAYSLDEFYKQVDAVYIAFSSSDSL